MLLLAVGVSCTIQDLLLTPPRTADKSRPSIGMIFIPGFGIDAKAYEPLGQALQDAFSSQVGMNLWFAAPHMPFDISTIGLQKAFAHAAQLMLNASIPMDHKTLYAGHSAGGAMLPYLVKDLKHLPEGFNKPDGMILMASFLVREFRSEANFAVGPGQYSFPNCPVLTIGGELDGLARLPRMAEAMYNQVNQNVDPDGARKTLPVTMIAGMTHMQFASGDIPNNVMNRDLLPEITYDQAHTAVAADVASFSLGIFHNDWATLLSRQEQSAEMLSPMIQALQMEGYHQFKPPCYCEAEDEYGGLEYGTCPQQPGCQSGSPWTQIAQQIMVGNPDWASGKGLLIKATDSQHIVTEEDPSCHLPHVHAGLDRSSGVSTPNAVANQNPGNGKGPKAPPLCPNESECTLTTNTITQLKYETGSELDVWRKSIGNDNFDTAYFPISASEMKSKMKSRQALLQAANNTDAVSGKASFDDLDAPSTGHCSEINAAAIQWAFDHASPSTQARYQQYGQKMVASVEDKPVCIAGPCWIWSPLEYKGRRDGGDVTVYPPTFAFLNENPYPCDEKLYPTDPRKVVLPCTAGMHYCKLVSPARVMEWIYVDSMRLNRSLKSQEVPLPKCCEACPAGTDKYYSVPKVMKNNCGESCIGPAQVELVKKLEPDLTKADSNTATPCNDLGFTVYKKTEVHSLGPVSATLDMYSKPKAQAADDSKCCVACPAGTDKYYSVPKVMKNNCGESCIAPDQVDTIKTLEPDLTKAASNTATPCIDMGFTVYDETDVHSLGPVSATLDMYSKPK
jgi:hypothetical protein